MDKVVVGIVGFFVFVGVFCLFGLLVGYPVKWLWNYLMPELFPSANIAHEITFWQAIGIYLLAGLLFRAGGAINTNTKSSS